MTNEWAHCPLLALQWTFAMHIIMIIGGYFPSQGLWMSSPAEAYQDRVDMYKAMSDDSTRRKGGPVEAASDGSEFPLSAADVWAFEEVRCAKKACCLSMLAIRLVCWDEDCRNFLCGQAGFANDARCLGTWNSCIPPQCGSFASCLGLISSLAAFASSPSSKQT
jgi:hypothetical protein